MSPTPINLPKALVIEKAREAYLAGRLIAQKPEGGSCYYRDEGGHPCGVGAAFTDEQAELVRAAGHNELAVEKLVSNGLVKTRCGAFLGKLQSAHDDWAHRQADDAHARFCHLLSLPTPQTQGGV